MSISFNKTIHEAFNIKSVRSVRAHRTQRTTPATLNSLTNIGNDTSISGSEYFLANGQTPSPNRFRILNHSLSRKPQSISLDVKRKEANNSNIIPSLILNDDVLPCSENGTKEYLLTPKANSKTQYPKKAEKVSKSLLDLFPSKPKDFACRLSIEKSEGSTNRETHRTGNSFYSKDSEALEPGKFTKSLNNLDTQGTKKTVIGSKLRKIVRRPQPPSKVDQILAGINVLDRDIDSTEASCQNKSRQTFFNTFTTKDSGRSTVAGMNSTKGLNRLFFRETVQDEKINKMSIPDIRQKLKEYGETINRQILSYKDSNIFNNFQKNYKLINGITEAEKNIISRKTEEERRRDVRIKFAKAIVKLMKKIKKLGLTIDDIIQHNAISTQPFQKPASAEFIRAAKIGDYDQIFEALTWNQYLVYDFDTTKQTALHWATKRNNTKIMKLLLEKGADPDARDMTGRTPLFLASKGASRTAVKLLLLYGASPLIKSDSNKSPIEYSTEFDIIHLLRRGSKIHAVLESMTWQKAQNLWDNLDLKEFQVRDEELL